MAVRVLVVDDHDGLRRTMCEVLERMGGYEVTQARNGWEALEAIRTVVFDVVTVDVKMPELDGCELIATLERERPEDAKKVVVLTGFPKSARERVGRHYPIVTKPFNTGELLEALELRLSSNAGR